MNVIPVAYQWLDTAHFRKKIPAGANQEEWTALVTAEQAVEMASALCIEMAAKHMPACEPTGERYPLPVLRERAL